MTALALLTKDGTLALVNKIECQAQLDIPTHSCRVSILMTRLNNKKKEKRLGVNVITAIPVASLSWVTNPPQGSIVE